jgi:MOSC domain-containing protein YiiM
MEVVAVSISKKKGTRKKNVSQGKLRLNFGLEGDAHGGEWHRQISLLAMESIEKMRLMGLEVSPGDFAENITTRGIDLVHLPVGTRLSVGNEAVLEVTQIGKECPGKCAIYYQVGDCIMPKEGIFARIIREGKIQPGDPVRILSE